MATFCQIRAERPCLQFESCTHVTSLISIPELGGIEIHLDRETGVWDKESILAMCRTIQEHNKTIVVWGELSTEELREFQTTLDPRGLAINYWDHLGA